MNVESRSGHAILYLGFAILVGISTLFAYWIFRPYRIITHSTPQRWVVNHYVHRGGELQFRASACKHGDDIAEVTRELVDGLLYVMPTVRTNYTQGCFTDQIISVTLPSAIPTGKYFMRITAQFHPNPLRTITYQFQTDAFWIIE